MNLTNHLFTWFIGKWEIFFHYYLKSWKIGFTIHNSVGYGIDLHLGPFTLSVFRWKNSGVKQVNEVLNEIGD